MYGFKECSSCEALYKREHCCLNVSFVANFVRDPNPISYDETPDSSQQPPRNCSKCRGPFGGLYCRQCTCERCRRNYTDEVCALCCYEVEKSFVNDSNSNSFIDSPNIFYPPSQPQTSSLDQWHCFHCKDPLERGERCKRCSCKWCGSGLSEGFCFICASNNKNSSIGDPNPNSFNDSQNLSDYPPQPQYQTNSCELCGNDAHYGYDCPPQVPFNCPAFYDDDDEYTIQYREYLENSSKAITPVLPTEEPGNSLSIGDEHLNTILETKTDKLIKSNVENLVPIPSESEDLSDNESECDVPVCDDFTTFSNLLFDSNDDFSSSDDESFSDEDVPKENFKIYSNPLFGEEFISSKIHPHHFNVESDLIESLLNRDILIVSYPKIDYLLEEFSGELTHINLIPPGINEADFDPEEEIHLIEELLYDNSPPRPPKESNSEISNATIKSSSPSPIPIEDNDDVYFDIEPDTGVLTTKVVDDISDNSTRELYVHVPNALPTLHPVFDTLLLFSSENEDKVFNPGILISKEEKSPTLLSHRGFQVFQLIKDSESLMMMYRGDIPILDVPYLHFYPLWPNQDCPDYEDSRARGFVHRPLDLQSFACLYMGIRYPRSY
ncbi:hypothetical protein Tco_1292451 [Tanacetum coccineum]